jgi:hypothetical protein
VENLKVNVEVKGVVVVDMTFGNCEVLTSG